MNKFINFKRMFLSLGLFIFIFNFNIYSKAEENIEVKDESKEEIDFFEDTVKDTIRTKKENFDPIKIYDELIKKKTLGDTETSQEDIKPKDDEIVLLLPKLDETLYKGWETKDTLQIWKKGEDLNFTPLDKSYLEELGIEKILKQDYKKDNITVHLLIYKFNNSSSAFSAYTTLHKGKPMKLKLGKGSSISDEELSFWKENYFVTLSNDIPQATTEKEPKTEVIQSPVKEFNLLASQEIARNILEDNLPPQIAFQFPSLDKISGSEKYCKGQICFSMYFPEEVFKLDPTSISPSLLKEGITGDYKLSTKSGEKIITLTLLDFMSATEAETAFKSLKTFFEKQEKEKKVKIELEDSTLNIKEDKKDYTIFKQKGSLLAILLRVPEKKDGERVLSLVQWPLEISFFITPTML